MKQKNKKNKEHRYRPYLIIQAPLDFWGLIFFGCPALIGIVVIRNNYVTTNLKFASDTLYLLIGVGAAFIAIIMGKSLYMLYGKDKAKDPRFIRFSYELEVTKEGTIFDAGDIRLDMMLCIGCYFAIQIALWVIGEEAYQVSIVDKFFFYIFAALIEEIIYRGAIVMLSQWFFAWAFRIKDGSQMWVVNIIVMLISGIAFAASHKGYYGDPIKMTITFLGGMSQAFWYIRSKVLIVPMAAHAAINLAYAGTMLQGSVKK